MSTWKTSCQHSRAFAMLYNSRRTDSVMSGRVPSTFFSPQLPPPPCANLNSLVQPKCRNSRGCPKIFSRSGITKKNPVVVSLISLKHSIKAFFWKLQKFYAYFFLPERKVTPPLLTSFVETHFQINIWQRFRGKTINEINYFAFSAACAANKIEKDFLAKMYFLSSAEFTVHCLFKPRSKCKTKRKRNLSRRDF